MVDGKVHGGRGREGILAFEVGSSWSTTLDLPAPELARLYEDHGTSEQFHAELKGELDLERLPSGKFKTNELVFQLGCLAFNLLRRVE